MRWNKKVIEVTTWDYSTDGAVNSSYSRPDDWSRYAILQLSACFSINHSINSATATANNHLTIRAVHLNWIWPIEWSPCLYNVYMYRRSWRCHCGYRGRSDRFSNCFTVRWRRVSHCVTGKWTVNLTSTNFTNFGRKYAKKTLLK